MHGNHIHITLAQYDVARTGAFGKIKAVKIPALVKNHRFLGIQVLGLSLSHHPAPETDYPVVGILDGKHYPVPELVPGSVFFIESRKPRLAQQLVRVTLVFQIFRQIVAGHIGKSQPEPVYGIVRQLPPFQIPVPCLSFFRAELIVKIFCRFFVDLKELCAPALPLFRFLVKFRLGELNARPLRKLLHGLGERIIFVFHKESKDISSRPAAEAMINLLTPGHRKRRRLFIMKRAQPQITASPPLQLYVS